MSARVKVSKIDDDYERVEYGDFSVVVMRNNGYVNANKLCHDANKDFRNWKANASSKELIRVLSFGAGKAEKDLLQTIARGKNVSIRGTCASKTTHAHRFVVWN